MEKYYTVDRISKILSIHPKTIQRYIREGKLRATKIGKSWRITGHDLSAFTERENKVAASDQEARKHPVDERIKVSAVVDIDVYDKSEAIHIIDMLTAALSSKPPEFGNSSMHTQHILEENKVRITLWGSIKFMEVMISSISLLNDHD